MIWCLCLFWGAVLPLYYPPERKTLTSPTARSWSRARWAQELVSIFTYLSRSVLVNCQRFFAWTDSFFFFFFGFNGTRRCRPACHATPRCALPDTAGNGFRWSALLERTWALDACGCKWTEWLLSAAVWSRVVGGSSWSSTAASIKYAVCWCLNN